MAKTLYVILEEVPGENGSPPSWEMYDAGVEASSAAGALRTALKGRSDLGERYVAVPHRSWQPQSVVVETQARLKFS